MFPKINQNIFLNITSKAQSYRSIVAEIEEEEILVGFPAEADLVGFFPDGTSIEVTFITNSSLYRFTTTIVGRKNGPFRMYRLIKPDEKKIEKVQRRDNVRVPSNLNIVLDDRQLSTINISAGGILCACNAEAVMKLNEIISGTIYIPNSRSKTTEPISFKAKVIRIDSTDHQEIKNVAVEFIQINQKDQLKIVQYCFELQRQMR